MSSNDDNMTATPQKEVTPPKLVGVERKGEEENIPSVKHNGQSNLSGDIDESGAHKRAVEFVCGACDGSLGAECVCGCCILIDEFYLKLWFSKHDFQIRELKDKIDRLKGLTV